MSRFTKYTGDNGTSSRSWLARNDTVSSKSRLQEVEMEEDMGSSANSTTSSLVGKLVLLGLVSAVMAGMVMKTKTILEEKKRRRRELATQVKEREDFSKMPMDGPGRGAPLMHGVRVIDFASHFCGPSVARVFAELGAEVVKVEPLEGDPLRYPISLLDHEQQPELFRSDFEVVNVGKYSVALDLKNSSAQLQRLLKDADIFITNKDPEELQSLGLSYDVLLKQFPHLVFAQVSSFGNYGQDHGNDGPDVGAFFGASGVSGVTHEETNRSFPLHIPGAGDFSTAQVLLAGINLALAQRLKTGLGQYVHTSLLHCGAWCVAPNLLEADLERGPTENEMFPLYNFEYPAQNPIHSVYRSGDGELFALLDHQQGHQFSFQNQNDPRAAKMQMMDCLGLKWKPEYEDDMIYEQVREEIGKMSGKTVKNLLRARKFLSGPVVTLPELWSFSLDGGERQQQHAMFLENICDAPTGCSVSRLVRLPYTFSKGNEHHFPKKPAPAKGEDTESVMANGWFDRPRASLAQHDQSSKNTKTKGFVVAELVDFTHAHVDYSISACTRILLEQGCSVIRIEPKGKGDPLKHRLPTLYDHYNSGKEILALGDLSTEGNAVLQELLRTRVNVFITNLSKSKLSHYNLDAQSLSQRCPALMIVQLASTRNTESIGLGALGGMFGQSGFASSLLPANKLEFPPPSLLEGMASFYLASATTLGLFHYVRTGEGQVINVSYDAIGHWSCQVVSGRYQRVPDLTEKLINLSKDHDLFPNPVMNAYRTKDGIWVQLVGGVDLVQALPKTLSCLGIFYLTSIKLIYSILAHSFGGSSEEADNEDDDMIKPLLKVFNQSIGHAIGKLTLAQFTQRANKHRVNFVPIRMPSQLLTYSQCHANGMFETMETGHGQAIRVTSPLQIG